MMDSGLGLQREPDPRPFRSESRVTLANEVERANILASGFWSGNRRTHLLPAFTIPRSRDDWPMGSRIQLQQRNCSGFAPDFLRRSTFF